MFLLTVFVTIPFAFYISVALVNICFASIAFKITANFPSHFSCIREVFDFVLKGRSRCQTRNH